MGYPQYPPQGETQYPPPNPQYGQRPPGHHLPQRQSPPGWALALLAAGAVLLLGMVASVFGESDDEKSADQVQASANATVLSRITQAAPFSRNPPPAATPPAAAPVESAPVTTEAPAASAVMPAVVCMNLQDAQDLIQQAGVFFSRSTDATGAGRMQVLDSNWVVVGQTPAPGALIGEGDAVLSVVKVGEPSRCR